MPPEPPNRCLTLDIEKYDAILDAPGLTPEQRRAYLEALWLVVVVFVDLGYQVSSAAPEDLLTEESSGYLGPPALTESVRAAAMVEWNRAKEAERAAHGKE